MSRFGELKRIRMSHVADTGSSTAYTRQRFSILWMRIKSMETSCPETTVQTCFS